MLRDPGPDATRDAPAETPSSPTRATRVVVSGRAWALVLGVIAVTVVVAVPLGRFPEWDEAVFLSQSGGLAGVDAAPSFLVASREIGTPVVLGLLRSVAPSLVNTRLLWMALALAVLVPGIVVLGRRLGFPPLVGVLVVSTYWLSLSFWTSFFSIFLATACMLLATGLYLTLRVASDHDVRVGLGLGAALAATLWFRQVEGALVVATIGVHSLIVAPRSFWGRRWRGVGATAATLVVAFAIPWALDSIDRFGSVGARLAAGQGQSFDRGLDSHAAEYLGVLVGRSQTYGDLTTPPDWAVVVLGLLLVLALGLTLYAVIRGHTAGGQARSDDGVSLGGRSMLWLLGLSQLAFFMFFIGVVTDRYMVSGGLVVLVAMTATAWPHVATWAAARHGGGWRGWAGDPRMVLSAVFAAWVVANAVVGGSYERARDDVGSLLRAQATTVQSLAEGRPCQGVTRYNAPQLQFGSGCDVKAAQSPEAVEEKLDWMRNNDAFTFVLWPERRAEDVEGALGPDASSLYFPTRNGPRELVLQYHPDPPPTARASEE